MSKYNLIDIYEQYRIGSGWTKDFDYDGMLKTGLGTSIDTPIEVLKRISDDFEDVNYHRENHHLQDAIDAIEIGDMIEAESRLNNFHAEIRKTQEEQGMDIEPTVGQFMSSKMEESEEVEEVTSREGSRIEGLLSIPLKAKFLNAFEELYFDLVEEDPFAAEDVVDHLANQMLIHLDDIQARGDKLAGIENPSVEFTPGERIGEEDTIDEVKKRDIRTALKQDAKGTDAEIDQYFTSLMKAGDEFDTMEDYVEDFKNYIADKSLQEHFGRFMKDYQ